jgi:glycosyltransferase involved in cell wall biosynthesis
VNGVVRTWETSIRLLRDRGHEVAVVDPGLFPRVRAPFYPEIRLALPGRRRVSQLVRSFAPDVVHVATEGPIGLAVRAFCRRNRWRFSTSYHSKFPEFLQHLARIPTAWSYRFMRWFHGASSAMMVSTPTLEADLAARGFRHLRRWSRGVDLTLFTPRGKTWSDYPRPVLLYAGRVSKEKNIDAFLTLKHAGTKVVVGDGPIRERLQREHPDVVFLGYRTGAALVPGRGANRHGDGAGGRQPEPGPVPGGNGGAPDRRPRGLSATRPRVHLGSMHRPVAGELRAGACRIGRDQWGTRLVRRGMSSPPKPRAECDVDH